MHKQTRTIGAAATEQLQALCALSDIQQMSPQALNQIIYEAPDPETATRAVLDQLGASCSEVLQRKWRQLVVNLWTQHHPHLPVILDLPITASDVNTVPAVQDSLALLETVSLQPAPMTAEDDEWLLTATAAHQLASRLPSLQGTLPIPYENEWQYLLLRRTRTVLQALKLVRRVKGELVIVKSRYRRFLELPTIQQHYLLWHAETYHINWAWFAGVWGDYLRIIQEYLPFLWSVSAHTLPDMPQDIRHWNQEIWDTFLPLWDQEGLLNRQPGASALVNLVRVHSLPTAITQVILKDLYQRYGLITIEDDSLTYTSLGVELLEAERTQDLPCALDLLK